MISGLRGLAQSFVRGAVAIGRAAGATYTTLSELGLGYVREQFQVDWNIYDQQKAFVDIASTLPKDQLISGSIHGESLLNLTTKFKYDVKGVYEDIFGKKTEAFWSVISDQRMTQQEILDQAAAFMKEYEPEKFPFYGDAEIVGIWARA